MTTTPQKIEPQKITKPIQLLAAWLVGLISIDGAFLFAAVKVGADSWVRGSLVIASIANVPVFIFALFLLQTKYRPELQEDIYYAPYLDKKTNKLINVDRYDVIDKELTAIRTELSRLIIDTSRQSVLPETVKTATSVFDYIRIGLNKRLSDFDELYALLKNRSIQVTDLFGSENPPESRVIAMTHRLDFQSKVNILKLACELNMDAYSFFDIYDETEIKEHALIGAYGEAEYPITPELISLLQSEANELDPLNVLHLENYELKYRKGT